MTRVVIAGGGISGLSVAWALRRRDAQTQITVLERAQTAGGNARTLHQDGYTCEAGPDGFLDNAPDTLRLVADLGLSPRLLRSSDDARRRFIYFNGHLEPAPTSPATFLKSRLLSPVGKARLLCEPFAAKPPIGVDESIHEFATRRIGNEAASVLIDAMVSGVFAGDARTLSLRASLPKMWEIEQTYGGLFRGLVATRRSRRATDAAGSPAGTLTSFINGMGELTSALADQLGPIVRTGTDVTGLRRTGGSHAWTVTSSSGDLQADTVVLAGPASDTAHLVNRFDAELGTELAGIVTAPLTVVCLGYDADAVGPLSGFGFLAPRSQRLRILGALWETSIYPNRAPAGKALLRVMIGGGRDREAIELSDDDLVACVRHDLDLAMGLSEPPEFVRILRHRRGIPQYTRGHLERMRRIEGLLQSHDGLHLTGNSFRGVSLNACITEAALVAEAALRARVAYSTTASA
jgi:protoporphyrinogen/coproporphyrinogen III oxidase